MPLSYFVSSAGGIQRRRVHDRAQLRGLRTELALLGRIDSLVCSGFCDDFPVHERKYGQEDREELSDIIRSAAHPIVHSMINVFDREFGSVREEIMMSVVQDEAERIVTEAAESGADLSATADAAIPSEPVPAEPESSETQVAADATPSPPEGSGQPVADPAASAETTDPTGEDAVEPVSPDVAESVDEVADETPDEATADATPPIEKIVEAVEPPSTSEPMNSAGAESIPDPVVDAAENAPEVEATPAQPETAAPSTPTPEPEPVAITPTADVIKMAEQAVAEIEAGVARLAEALGIETRFCDKPPSTHAVETEIAETQTPQPQTPETDTADPTADHQAVSAIHDEGAEILARIKEFHEEIRIARDEADTARQEASSFREDARRAKQRSEASADAAERSADEAAREAQNARMSQGESPRSEPATTSLP